MCGAQNERPNDRVNPALFQWSSYARDGILAIPTFPWPEGWVASGHSAANSIIVCWIPMTIGCYFVWLSPLSYRYVALFVEFLLNNHTEYEQKWTVGLKWYAGRKWRRERTKLWLTWHYSIILTATVIMSHWRINLFTHYCAKYRNGILSCGKTNR